VLGISYHTLQAYLRHPLQGVVEAEGAEWSDEIERETAAQS
jgi:hypothetical protein